MSSHENYEKIMACIEQYADGAVRGSSEPMKAVVHEGAQIFGYLDGQLLAGPMKLLFDYVDSNPGAGPELKWAASLIDECDGVACARIVIEGWHGHTFTDYMTFLEIDGSWKIMNKVFSHL